MTLRNAFEELAVESTQKAIQRGAPDQDVRFEFVAIAGKNKILYRGVNDPASATTDSDWQIERYTWQAGPAGDNVPVLIQTRTGAWDDRASLPW